MVVSAHELQTCATTVLFARHGVKRAINLNTNLGRTCGVCLTSVRRALTRPSAPAPSARPWCSAARRAARCCSPKTQRASATAHRTAGPLSTDHWGWTAPQPSPHVRGTASMALLPSATDDIQSSAAVHEPRRTRATAAPAGRVRRAHGIAHLTGAVERISTTAASSCRYIYYTIATVTSSTCNKATSVRATNGLPRACAGNEGMWGH